MPSPLSPPELAACSRILLRLQEAPGSLETPCWLWPGSRNSRGYGTIKIPGTVALVHRLLYRALVGNPGRRRQLHHRCENILCANPAHLEPLTAKRHGLAHIATRRLCRNGLHPMTPDNLFVTRSGANKGKRQCRACAIESRALRAAA